MQTVQLVHISIRYMVFTANNHYYLLDRKPVNILGYFFPYINWLFKQKIHLISEPDFAHLIEKKQKKSGIGLNTSLIGGITVLSSFFIRKSKLLEQLATNLSTGTILLILFLSFVVALFLVRGIHGISKSSLNSAINLNSKEFHYYKLRPPKIDSATVKLIFMYSGLWLITIVTIFSSVLSRSILFFIFSFLMYFIVLFLSVIGYRPNTSYCFYPEQDSPNQQKKASEDLF
ncbi:MAG: DUF443 family protein [Streptococcus sp.]|nr:DUF443 family protein [Streptococcus sp.]